MGLALCSKPKGGLAIGQRGSQGSRRLCELL
jgi:hypothetical protein